MASATTLTQQSVDYLKRNYKYLVEDPSYFWMKTLARFELARELARGSSIPVLLAGGATRFDSQAPGRLASDTIARVTADHGTEGSLRILDTEGYYVGLRLTQDTLTQLERRIALTTCYGDGDRNMPFEIDERASAELRYQHVFKRGSYLQQHEHWSEFRMLREDRCLLDIAGRYLGCTPVYLGSDLSWAYAPEHASQGTPNEAAPFQCDIHDFRSVTFTFYLTDVGPGNGPHAYVKKNPRRRPLSHQLLGKHYAEPSERQLAQTYGADQIVTIYGPKGLGFVGDPYYLHRSTAPTQSEHLILQLELGCKRYRSTGYHY